MCKIVVKISQVSQMSQESTCAGAFFNKVEKRLLWNLRNFENTLFSRGCFWQFQVSSLQLYWKRNSDKLVFSVNLAKFLSISFDRTSLDDCFLCLSVNFEKFFRTPILWSTSGKLLISCTSCRISTCRYSKKLFHRCFSSILYKKEK